MINFSLDLLIFHVDVCFLTIEMKRVVTIQIKPPNGKG